MVVLILTLQEDGCYRYCGVGRWDGAAWQLPALDFATWKRLGTGRGASRRLPPRWRDAALAHATALLERVGEGAWIEARGKRCRLVGRAKKGGLRIDSPEIDGDSKGFRPRTISLLDLGWVLATRHQHAGQPIDEAAVNRLCFLEGTPKVSTRWIDTGWALVLTDT